MDEWKVQIKGRRGSGSWEMSVVRKDNKHGQESWGWLGKDKLLISHNGGPCHDKICGYVWDANVEIAHEVCRRLNAGGSVSEKKL